MQTHSSRPTHDLRAIAHRAMIARGLVPDFERETLAELATIQSAPCAPGNGVRDMRSLMWCSIDNDSSRDLDQLTVAEALSDDAVKIFIAVADVDALVLKAGAIDRHASHNTTSVYTPAAIFSMLPERLSTDLTSLNPGEDRLAIVIEMTVQADGTISHPDVYRAAVHNYAKLAYNSVAAWLTGTAPAPDALAAVKGLGDQIRLQDGAAQCLRKLRHEHGALSLQTIQPSAVYVGGELTDIKVEEANRAKELIEDFMIAANGVTAKFLKSKRFPSLRRIVRDPKRWERIVAVAAEFGGKLPTTPDALALETFLLERKKADALRFPDLSLTVVKLMGRGEYAVDLPDEEIAGHFGLAVKDYTHSTAPNRRYPDVLTQRLLKAAIAGRPVPYSDDELKTLAAHCTEMEDAASKVERQVRKSCAALLLEHQIGKTFDAIVTGASDKGTYVRSFHPPVEGRVTRGSTGLDVGDRVTVRLERVDVEHGYIDFSNVKNHGA
ncbi:MAG: RNB domain-containing ribonuclease [Planctomycetota bacterium]